MKVKVLNQTFDSKNVPMAIIIEDEDILNIGTLGLKGAGKPSLYFRSPSDIPLEVVAHWLNENVPEFDFKDHVVKMWPAGKPKDGGE